MKLYYKWKMKDGKKILISKMSDSHLLNSMALCERWSVVRKKYLDNFYLTCVEPNGEMAQICFEREQGEIWDSTWRDWLPDVYWSLVNQAEKRKILTQEWVKKHDEALSKGRVRNEYRNLI